MDLTLSLILLIILAGFIKGFTGFGLSLVLISVLLEAGFKPSEFLPIIVPIFVVLDLFLLFQNRKNINLDNYRENFPLHSTTLITLFLGTLLGTYLLTVINSEILKLAFAITILISIFFLIEKVTNFQMKTPKEINNGIFGLITGTMAGLFTINGITTSEYLIYHQYPKGKYMGTYVTFLVISDWILVAVYLFKGLFTFEYLKISIIFLMITTIGFAMGSFIRKYVPTKKFKAIVILFLAIDSIKIIFDFFLR